MHALQTRCICQLEKCTWKCDVQFVKQILKEIIKLQLNRTCNYIERSKVLSILVTYSTS